MLRFTIRDLLWLMVVMGLTCGLYLNVSKCHSLSKQLAELDRRNSSTLQHFIDQRDAVLKELERISGKRVEGPSGIADTSSPNGFRWKIEYSDINP